jgi:curved DNA-binding protein CbpA
LKTFYDLLSVTPDASADEIKAAFRREIARYHPDKVQHLGKEFQDMASGIAADLTEAYRILMDPALRAKYDDDLSGPSGRHAAPGAPRPAAQQAPPPPAPPSAFDPFSGSQAPPRASSDAGVDFVKKASLLRIREAVTEIVGPGAVPASGFDLAVTSTPKRGLFKKAEEPVRLLVKFVPSVDAAAVAEAWPNAMKSRSGGAILCLLLVGPALAPAKDLAAAISEQRRKSQNAGPVLVPVDVRDWEALIPPDTPASVRALIQHLKEQKR